MNTFTLQSSYKPAGDQPQAIQKLTENLRQGVNEQVLLGVTGSGKTYTMASVIEKLQRPTLIISHNKTLAAQLYQEFREFFPTNAVSYFVSYYDYYQPEAYVPQTDTYIEKETEINEELDKLRLAATTNVLTRPDTLIVASVSSIYNIGSPKEYGHFVLELKPGMNISRESIFERLVQLQYERTNMGFARSTFRVRGNTIDLYPAYQDQAIRIVMTDNEIVGIETRDPLTGNKLDELPFTIIYPAKHYMTDPQTYKGVFETIRQDLDIHEKKLKKEGKHIEAQRIRQRVEYDLEMIAELGYVNGVENYSRYFDGRNPGDPPYTLFDYFTEATGGVFDPQKWLLIIDESHMTVPQIRGMYNGDRSRKQTLIDFGFRLPSALDNRPLQFEEFLRGIPQTVYVSATPDAWEMERVMNGQLTVDSGKNISGVVEQLVRPTGLIDPEVQVRPTEGQIDDLMKEIAIRVSGGERVLVTTLTKRMAEDLSKYMEVKGIKVQYLHSDVLTLKRTDILADLRRGAFDVLIGINLLREGLDLPEVSLVAILDADKQGFLRSKISLVQTMGRAARHLRGQVILYADVETPAMKQAIDEVGRRRAVQLAYNATHGITPASIQKPIRNRLVDEKEAVVETDSHAIDDAVLERMTPQDKKRTVQRLKKLMQAASKNLDFEEAARLRDLIKSMSLSSRDPEN